MANLEMTVRLPSLGKPYPETPELAGDITIKMISALQEKRLFGSSGQVDLIDTILKECIVKPDINIDILMPADKHFLLTKLRIHTYGPQYHVMGTNPVSEKSEEHLISLNDVPVIELNGEFKDPITVELPVSGDTVELKVLRSGDYKRIRQRVKRLSKEMNIPSGEQEYITRLAASIVSVNGQALQGTQKEQYVQNLMGRDTAEIKRLVNQYKFGLSDYISVTSPVNGEEYDVPVLMTGEFFRPRYD